MGSLCCSHVPRELEGENRDEEVEIGLVDKRQEDYVPPPAPAYTAFSGEGQTMGCVLQSLPAALWTGVLIRLLN